MIHNDFTISLNDWYVWIQMARERRGVLLASTILGGGRQVAIAIEFNFALRFRPGSLSLLLADYHGGIAITIRSFGKFCLFTFDFDQRASNLLLMMQLLVLIVLPIFDSLHRCESTQLDCSLYLRLSLRVWRCIQSLVIFILWILMFLFLWTFRWRWIGVGPHLSILPLFIVL